MLGNHDRALSGTGAEMVLLREEIHYIRRSDAKVLISGDSTIGKGLVARAVHSHSSRSFHPFVPVSCAAMSETLLESELFGHVKGGFAGADRDKSGTLELADQGTLFLDDVDELSPRMQMRLLWFLETGEIQRVGSDRRSGHVNVRIIAASKGNLYERVTQGRFREDLFYRLNVIHIVVPPVGGSIWARPNAPASQLL